jgi:hypothetical protein
MGEKKRRHTATTRLVGYYDLEAGEKSSRRSTINVACGAKRRGRHAIMKAISDMFRYHFDPHNVSSADPTCLLPRP